MLYNQRIILHTHEKYPVLKSQVKYRLSNYCMYKRYSKWRQFAIVEQIFTSRHVWFSWNDGPDLVSNLNCVLEAWCWYFMILSLWSALWHLYSITNPIWGGDQLPFFFYHRKMLVFKVCVFMVSQSCAINGILKMITILAATIKLTWLLAILPFDANPSNQALSQTKSHPPTRGRTQGEGFLKLPK